MRDDLLGGAPAPATWDEVLALARAQPGRVAVPVAPAQAMCSFLTLCANAGHAAAEDPARLVDPEVGLRAVSVLSELYRLGPPEAVALGAARGARRADRRRPARLRPDRVRLRHLRARRPRRVPLPLPRPRVRRSRADRRHPRRRRALRVGGERAPVRGRRVRRVRERRRRPARDSSALPAASPAAGRPGPRPSSTAPLTASSRVRARPSSRRGCGRASAGGRHSSSRAAGC